MADVDFSSENQSFRQIWRENHGNFLLVFTAVILLVGGVIMAMPSQQGRRVLTGVADESEETPSAINGLEEVLAGLDAQEIATVIVRVTGIGRPEGVLRIALYRAPENFNNPEQADAKANLEIREDGTALWEVRVPANQPFAISAFHDVNGNGDLDTNLIGIPTEKYGFSKGARSPQGAPDFAEAAVIPQPGVVEIPLEIW